MLVEFKRPNRAVVGVPAPTAGAATGPIPRAFRPSVRTALERLDRAIARPPCVVMLGESNSGKTSLVNSLLGHALLPTSVVTNTRLPLLLHFDELASVSCVSAAGRSRIDAQHLDGSAIAQSRSLEVGLPNERLKSFDIMDTPGQSGASFLLQTGELTPLQLLVWCTVATQAWKESERRTWLSLPRSYRAQAILAVTHADDLKSPAEKAQVEFRLRTVTGGLFKHIVFVTTGANAAASGPASVQPNGRHDNDGLAEFESSIRDGVAAIRRKRYRTAERIVRRMVRLVRDGSETPTA